MDESKFRNIDPLLGKVPCKVDQVGVELEGGWNSVPEDTQVARDSSVKFEGELSPEQEARFQEIHLFVMRRGNYPSLEVGEEYQRLNVLRNKSIPRFVGEISGGPFKPEEVPKWMRAFYPHKVNSTCGLHVHMSFSTALRYQRLMCPEYGKTILEYVRRWADEEKLDPKHPLRDRLKGTNKYCQDRFFASEQAKSTLRHGDHLFHDQNRHGHRYTVINYCYKLHNTVECRLLPMFEDPKQSIRAVQRIIDITSAFLSVKILKETRVRQIAEADRQPFHHQISADVDGRAIVEREIA